MQLRGATALPVLTTPFREVLDRVMSYYRPDREMPLIVLEHPMQNISEAELDARAEQLATAAERFLEGVA